MMENNKKDPASMVEGWLDEILSKLDIPEAPEEDTADQLGADEQAVAAAGLTHPDDMELERIVQQTIAENWGEDFSEDAPREEKKSGNTQYFAPAQDDEPVQEEKE